MSFEDGDQTVPGTEDFNPEELFGDDPAEDQETTSLEQETQEEQVPFHKHPRFQELVKEKNERKASEEYWKNVATDLRTQLQGVVNQKAAQIGQEAPEVTPGFVEKLMGDPKFAEAWQQQLAENPSKALAESFKTLREEIKQDFKKEQEPLLRQQEWMSSSRNADVLTNQLVAMGEMYPGFKQLDAPQIREGMRQLVPQMEKRFNLSQDPEGMQFAFLAVAGAKFLADLQKQGKRGSQPPTIKPGSTHRGSGRGDTSDWKRVAQAMGLSSKDINEIHNKSSGSDK